MSDPTNKRRDLPAVVAGLWVVGFCVLFLSFRLPNNPQIARYEFWALVPGELLDLVLPPAADDRLGALPAGYRYLPQRLPLLAVAAFVLLGCRAIGARLFAALRLDPAGDDRLVRETFAWALGLSAWSLLVLVLGLAGLLLQWLFVAILVLALAADCWFSWRRRRPSHSHSALRTPHSALALLVVAPFLVAIVLGAALPPTDFDVRAYHLLGPKEFFLAGRIGFLEHNVYTSFPFLTEMLSLSGMVVWGDWFRGALVGQLVLAAFAPLTALALHAAARRWFGPAAGWVAVVVYLTTPWTFRISTIAYAEGGLSFYLLASILAAALSVEALRAGEPVFRPVLLAGLMAGSAMACKYPALVTVVVPVGAVLCAIPFVTRSGRESRIEDRESGASAVRRPRFSNVVPFALGLALSIAPWLAKNLFETGNPVYPLAYGLFGGRDLTPERAAKWAAAHAPSHHDPAHLADMVVDVSARNDWLSPLPYAFAPLALLVFVVGSGPGGLETRPTNHEDSRPATLDPRPLRPRRLVVALSLYVVYHFLAWWLLTHRIDRFWVPMLPVVALLAGIGATRFGGRAWWSFVAAVIAVATAFNLAFVTSGLAGNNAFRADLDAARLAFAPPAVAATNAAVPPGSRVLCVGEAQVFDATFEPVYNTVFDESIFENWFAQPVADRPAGEWPLLDTRTIRRRLADENVAYVLVNWAELLRYRVPGSYGYTDFVAPRRFDELQRRGLLGQPIREGEGIPLNDAEAAEVRRWAPELLTTDNGEARPVLRTAWQLFPVPP